MLPELSRLSADVPESERHVFVLDLLDVEADRGDRFFELAVLELEEQCGLSCVVEAEEQDLLVCFLGRLRLDRAHKTQITAHLILNL